MGEQSLTYEELFELLRKERNSEELQTLDSGLYGKIVSYLSAKKSVLDDTSEEAQLFGSSEKDKVKVQLENARKIVKELVERREKKIILLALNRARTESDIIDTSSLLEVEQAFFHRAVKLFSTFKEGVLENIVSMNSPKFSFADVESSASPSKADSIEEKEEDESEAVEESSADEGSSEGGSEEREDENRAENGEKGAESEETSEGPEKEEVAIKKVKVKFKSSIPRFMGKNEEVYGPYEAEDTAEISNDIARVLIKKGRAVEVE